MAGWVFVRLLALESPHRRRIRTSALSFVNAMATKSTTAERARPAAEPGMLVLVCLAAWAVPGAAHLWLGRRQKGLVFLLALPVMFLIGLLLQGRIFPFDLSEPLVALAAVAGYRLRAAMDCRPGRRRRRRARLRPRAGDTATASSSSSGLLNSLVVLDAFDIAMGRK